MRHFPRLAFAVLFAFLGGPIIAQDGTGPIRPYAANPFYWEYHGAPILLLGASVVDNLHHWHDLEAHLDELQAAQVNYLRVSLSMGTRAAHGGDDRPLPHDQPFLQLPSGRYDLNHWDPVFWDRLERLLTLAHERGMIVELELFNRFDFWRGFWQANAWNPRRNVNYTEAETGLAPTYAEHPTEDVQPFFHSVPTLADQPVLLSYQIRYINRVLDLTLRFDNVLYTINNETSTDPAWGRYWIDHARARAEAAGKEIYLTDMFEEHVLSRDPWQQQVVANPGVYDFVSAGQVTSLRSTAAEQRSQLAWLRQELAAAPRPITVSKVYGSDAHRLTDYRRRSFQRYGDRTAVHSFWMTLMSGTSSARFHRINAGLGPSPRAFAAIRAARLMEAVVAPWDMVPADELLLSNGQVNIAADETALGVAFALPEAHAMARPGQGYAVFFTRGGEVELVVQTTGPEQFDLRWIDIETGAWGPSEQVGIDRRRRLSAPGSGSWLCVLTRADGV
ncbi:MAG: hypothetical protein ACT4OK_21885 [Gemmobacter sp.]